MCVLRCHHLADTGDMKGGPFRMILALDYQVGDLCDMSGFIGGPIHILDWDGSG